MAHYGIDLGTTHSAVAVIDAAGPAVIVPNGAGHPTTPSALLFESATDVVVGRPAARAAAAEPEHVALDVKRSMGDALYPRPLRGRRHSPVMLSAMILKKIARDAAERVGPPEGVVVTVPAYFNEARRQATAAACTTAGLPLVDIINEPTAAALAYAYERLLENNAAPAARAADAALFRPRTLVVYDLGGGTFDVSVLRCEGHELRVLATAGDVHLGGRDWDARVADHLAELFADVHGVDPRDDDAAHRALLDTAETLKHELSTRTRARYTLHHAGHRFGGELTRAEMEDLTADLLFRTSSRLTRALAEAGVAWDEIDEVLAVGGSTRMPAVIQMLADASGQTIGRPLSPDTAVAQGAAVHAAVCAARGKRGASPEPGSPPGVTPVPIDTDTGLRGRLGRLARQLRLIRTVNVSAHTLGVVVQGKNGQPRVRPMLPRGSALPCDAERTFGTQKHHQRRVTVQIVEGESTEPEHAYPLGTCHITDLPESLPLGSPVEVRFHYDHSGRLSVKALHVTSGRWAQTVIERLNGIDPQQIAADHALLAGITLS